MARAKVGTHSFLARWSREAFFAEALSLEACTLAVALKPGGIAFLARRLIASGAGETLAAQASEILFGLARTVARAAIWAFALFAGRTFVAQIA